MAFTIYCIGSFLAGYMGTRIEGFLGINCKGIAGAIIGWCLVSVVYYSIASNPLL